MNEGKINKLKINTHTHIADELSSERKTTTKVTTEKVKLTR